MRNFVSVNTLYYKTNRSENNNYINTINNHNSRISDVDYLLDEKDRKYENQEIVYDNPATVPEDSDSIPCSCGSYMENYLNYLTMKKHKHSNKTLTQAFNKSLKRKHQILKAKNPNYRPSKKDIELVEMSIGLSEEMALYYLDNNIDLMKGFDKFAQLLRSHEKYSYEPLAINLHKDEGKYIKDKAHYNIHGHLVLHNFSFSKQKSILRTMKKKDWENIQDLAQEAFQSVALDFRRGISKKITHKQHLKRNDYILQQQEIELNETLEELSAYKNELKQVYTTLNEEKNSLKELRKEIHRDSNLYKVLSTNIKNLTQREKQFRQEHKNLSKSLKSKKDELQKVELNVENSNEYLVDLKKDMKHFLKDSTYKNKANKYEIRDINEFYHSLVETFNFASNMDLKLQELEVIKSANAILRDKIEKLETSNTNLNIKLEQIEIFQEKINELIEYKNSLEDENYTLKKFIDEQELEEEYNSFLNSIDKTTEKDFNR
ncbi:coiled-coil domain-containing protein [Arcobacter peruensis]|uniref:hypothetical protein n=1 Tax=Arcobacter peruensis TaxID=2320140 RepID=UPI000F099033|nr:hypothetical protein [Arcobacter peruensis]